MFEIVSSDFSIPKGISIATEEMRIDILDNRFQQGIIDYKIQYLDLRQLCKITLLYEFPDYERRRQQAAERESKRRATNAVSGALVGGLVDSMTGEDDTVLDGALLGSVVGALSTRAEKIDLKEQSEHLLVLCFRDGHSVTARVDAAGYALMLRMLHRATTLYADLNAGPYLNSRDLVPEEIAQANEAAVRQFSAVRHKGSDTGFLLSFLLIATMAILVVFNPPPYEAYTVLGLGLGAMVAVFSFVFSLLHRRTELTGIASGLKAGGGRPRSAAEAR